MPVSRPNPPTGTQPSSVSIGKKPMNYAQTTQQQSAPQQQQPKSARAASKAPVYNQQQQQQQQIRHPSPPTSNTSGGAKTRSAAGATASSTSGPTAAQKGKANANKIWSTSTTEERERIKYFWLGLGEQERRNLVKIEKDTVLRKMKEQQKHSCSCAVCGRKRFVSFGLPPVICPSSTPHFRCRIFLADNIFFSFFYLLISFRSFCDRSRNTAGMQ